MDKLTDLEICKRIAEIEGFKDIRIHANNCVDVAIGDLPTWKLYNPLTNDALWANLIIKHEISICFTTCSLTTIKYGYRDSIFHDIPSLKRNSLLLIIEVHSND